jgi:hypothetical protein
VLLAVGFVGVLMAATAFLEFLSRDLDYQKARIPGLVAGLVMGGSLGIMALNIAHGLVTALLGY